MISPFCLSKARSAMHFRAKTEACFWKLSGRGVTLGKF